MPSGEVLDIATGDHEEHIVADVAWAASCYLDWTGDQAFAAGPGREILVETARYWASRIRVDPDRLGHIDGVIGPDEYHEDVADNAFTNGMARWNLRQAAAVTGDAEAADWRRLADVLVDGYDPATRRYEQFAGYFGLQPLIVADVAARRPVAADLLLGRDRVRASQLIKQADVLMLHYLVPDEVAADSLDANLDFYEPRTAHGSSLSPAVHAALLARAGRMTDALTALRIAARIDLDDLTGTTASGVHLATMGGLWQAIVFGFGGVRPCGDVLIVDPHLPAHWRGVDINLCFRGTPLTLHLDRHGVDLRTEGPLALVRSSGRWEVRAR
jgi:trehalose/maltose hydrolase-like predicted phosphorylase